MKVMGIKVSSQCVRYAILEKTSSGEVVFCNPDTIWLVSARNLAENSKMWFAFSMSGGGYLLSYRKAGVRWTIACQ